MATENLDEEIRRAMNESAQAAPLSSTNEDPDLIVEAQGQLFQELKHRHASFLKCLEDYSRGTFQQQPEKLIRAIESLYRQMPNGAQPIWLKRIMEEATDYRNNAFPKDASRFWNSVRQYRSQMTFDSLAQAYGPSHNNVDVLGGWSPDTA